jgi:ligand-binding SRPBCC domain-containing protein
MKIYRLHYRQELAVSIHEAWKFFSSPFHLNEITPVFFHVDILSPVPDDIYGGLLIEYSMNVVLGIPMTWLSEISHCDKPRRFVYIQRAGPFKFWSHEVCLTENTTGVILEDIVFYAMPLDILGRMLNKILIARKLTEIFNTRRAKLALHWG